MSYNFDEQEMAYDDEMMQTEDVGAPRIQWLRGNPQLAQVNPILGSGGFELPHNQWGDILGDNFPVVEVTHGQNVTKAYLFKGLHVSRINDHMVWRRWLEGEKRYEYAEHYKPSFKSRLQIYCVIKELLKYHPDVVIISVGGMNCKAWRTITQLHQDTIVKHAGVIGAKDRYPRFSFWMPVKAGERKLVGQEPNQSYITPPVHAWNDALFTNPTEATNKATSKLYVGADTDGFIVSEFWKAGVEWKANQEKRNNQAQEVTEPAQPEQVQQPAQPQSPTQAPMPNIPEPQTPPVDYYEEEPPF